MNIYEQQLLKEALQTPMTEREEVLALEIQIQREAISKIETLSSCADWDQEDPDAGKIYHELFDAIEDVQMVRSELRAMKQFAERLTKEWFDKNDDLPDEDTSPLAYWFAVKLQGLEMDDCCMAESALSVAVQAIKKLCLVQDEIENTETYLT